MPDLTDEQELRAIRSRQHRLYQEQVPTNHGQKPTIGVVDWSLDRDDPAYRKQLERLEKKGRKR